MTRISIWSVNARTCLVPYSRSHKCSTHKYEFCYFWGCAYNRMCFPRVTLNLEVRQGPNKGCAYNRRCAYDRENTVYHKYNLIGGIYWILWHLSNTSGSFPWYLWYKSKSAWLWLKPYYLMVVVHGSHSAFCPCQTPTPKPPHKILWFYSTTMLSCWLCISVRGEWNSAC